MNRIYVGCALTQAPEEFRRNVAKLKEALRRLPGVEVLEFLGLTEGTAKDVYIHDIHECVGTCDILVAICDFPSIGLGWEMATQVGRGKPLLAFAHHDAKITRLILDPPVDNYRFTRYYDFDEVVEVVRYFVK